MRYFLTVRRKVVVGHPAPHVCCELQRWSASYATTLVSNTRMGQKVTARCLGSKIKKA